MSRDGTLRFTGRVENLSPADRSALFDRQDASDALVRERTSAIVQRVRRGGDRALRALALELDDVSLQELEVPRATCDRALATLPSPLRSALERAAANIRAVHECFRPRASETESMPGVIVGRRPDPLARVGVYAPGGRAAYPSSVLMGIVPARVAGVGEVVLCSPPSRETGLPSDVVLAAASLAGADRVFALGGAGAVAAMAYGTLSVPRVDRIVGPGNAYVAEAKLQVASAVAIDSPAGPSELLVLSDHTADADVIAREMLAQAEHDPLAAVVAVTTSASIADAVRVALVRMLDAQPRSEIIRQALAARGAVLVAADLTAAINFANAYASEHLLVLAEDEMQVLARVRSAGTVFVGAAASVAFGDYMTGANHVLPTGGLARSYSGLSTLDFVRWTTYQRVSADAAAAMAEDTGVLADAEGLGGHAIAARAWARGGAA